MKSKSTHSLLWWQTQQRRIQRERRDEDKRAKREIRQMKESFFKRKKRQHAREKYYHLMLWSCSVSYTGSTYTFSSSDVNRAGDIGEAFVHAHLQVDHSKEIQKTTQAGCWSSNTEVLTYHICLYEHIHSVASSSCKSLTRCQILSCFVHTCSIISTRKYADKNAELKAFEEVSEVSTHGRNLFCLDWTQTSDVETTDS